VGRRSQRPRTRMAYCRVYNDWIADFCRHSPNRLYGVAHISLMDVDAAIMEVKRIAKLGLKSVMLTPFPANGKAYGDMYYDPFWAVAQEIGIPVGLHVIARPDFHGSQWYQHPTFHGSPFYLKTAHNSDVGVRFIGPAPGLDKSSPYGVGGTLHLPTRNPCRGGGAKRP